MEREVSVPGRDRPAQGREGKEAVNVAAADDILVGEETEESTPENISAGDILDAPEEQSDVKRTLPTPELPSLSDILKHRECHVPYQSWCDHCVEGRGRELGHNKIGMASRSVPTIAFDYMIINDKGVFTAEERAAMSDGDHANGVKALVVKDTKSRMVFAHVVPVKGGGQ